MDIIQNLSNKIPEYNFLNNLDNISVENSKSKLIEAYNILIKDGVITISGIDLRELCRSYFLNHITTQEFYNLIGHGNVSMTERIEQLEEVGFSIIESELTGMTYYIKAVK